LFIRDYFLFLVSLLKIALRSDKMQYHYEINGYFIALPSFLLTGTFVGSGIRGKGKSLMIIQALSDHFEIK